LERAVSDFHDKNSRIGDGGKLAMPQANKPALPPIRRNAPLPLGGNLPVVAPANSKLEAIMAMERELREDADLFGPPELLPGTDDLFEKMDRTLDADNERDQNAGFHESHQSSSNQTMIRQSGDLNISNLLLNEQLLLRGMSIAALRRRRRGGYALATRTGRIGDLLCAEEADAADELMRSIYDSESGGLQQTMEALVNLARQMANALKGELPVDVYAGQSAEDFRRLISIIAERRCQLMREIFEEPLGEGCEPFHELLCQQVKAHLERHVAASRPD
jgi:hypothetical protein